jgi:hypothetical protein
MPSDILDCAIIMASVIDIIISNSFEKNNTSFCDCDESF